MRLSNRLLVGLASLALALVSATISHQDAKALHTGHTNAFGTGLSLPTLHLPRSTSTSASLKMPVAVLWLGTSQV